MAWYDFFKRDKLNPVQPDIVDTGGGPTVYSRENPVQYTKYYETLECVNRSVNMIVDDVSEVPAKIGDQIKGLEPVVKGVRKTRVDLLLNKQPNPFQDISSFRRNLVIDLLLDGNIFIHFDGAHIYHLPANQVVIKTSSRTWIEGFEFNNTPPMFPASEVIFIKENSFDSIFRGTSRLRAARDSLSKLESMNKFQQNFFKNGTVMGLAITTEHTLSEKVKERMIQSWMTKYNPTGGGRRPMILDGGLKVEPMSNTKFSELDFEESVDSNELKVLKVLGVPPVLLNSGNNANLRPNHRLYYLETVTPIIRKINFAFERYFGYEVTEDITNIPALQPELSEQGAYLSSLVNAGIMSRNEARAKLGLESMEGHDELVIPQNVAGSAVDPSQGGRPEENTDD